MSEQEHMTEVVEKCKTNIFSAHPLSTPRVYDTYHDEELNKFSDLEFDSYQEWLEFVEEIAENHLNVPTDPDELEGWSIYSIARSVGHDDRFHIEEKITFANFDEENERMGAHTPKIIIYHNGRVQSVVPMWGRCEHESVEEAVERLETLLDQLGDAVEQLE